MFIKSVISVILCLNLSPVVSAGQSNSNDAAQTSKESKAGNKSVERRVNIKSRPAPKYPKEAKETWEYQVSATVKLRMALRATGEITNIEVVSITTSDKISDKLRDGFIRESVKAAGKIKFEPAERDGRKVSQYVAIEYNFNLK